MDERRKLLKSFWIAIAVVLAVAVSAPILFLWHLSTFERRPPDVTPLTFDSAGWQQAAPIENYRTVRSQMVDDLVRRRILDGLNRTEVERLLGPPLPDLSDAGVDASRWHVGYYMGMERLGAFSLDDELLVIRFDAQGRVTKYATVSN